jgi:hypothetical protein
MALDEDSIWVTDIDCVWKIDRKTGDLHNRIQALEGSFLVGTAIGKNRELMVADLLSSRILSLKDVKFDVVCEGPDLQSPTRLISAGDELVVASWGYTTDFSGENVGSVFLLNTQTKHISRKNLPMSGHWMGLCSDGSDGWFVADFGTGTILRVLNSGDCERIISLGPGLGDVLYVPAEKLLIVAHITENRVVAFQLSIVK